MENDYAMPTLSVSKILARGFAIYFRNFIMFTLVGVAVYLPLGVVLLLIADGVIPYTPVLVVLLSLAFLAFEAIVTLVLCRAAWDSSAGREVSFADSWRAAQPRFLAGLGTGALVGLATVLGFAVFVVPGILVLVWTWVALPVCLVEKKGPIASFNRSRELLRGHGWKIFGLVLLIGLFDRLPDKLAEYQLNHGEIEVGIYLLVVFGTGAILSPIRAALVAVAYDDARELFKQQDIEAVASIFGADVNDTEIPEIRDSAEAAGVTANHVK